MTSRHGRSACLAVSMRFVHFTHPVILDRVPKYSTKLIDILVIRLRVEYFLFGDRHVRALRLPRHSLAALVMRSAAVHSMLLFNYCIHSHGEYSLEYNKYIGSLPLLRCGGRLLRSGLFMTEVYSKCIALFIVRRRTPAWCE